MDKVYYCEECLPEDGCNAFFIPSEWKCAVHSEESFIETNIDWDEFDIMKNISENPDFIFKMMELKKNDIIEYETKMSQFRNQIGEKEQQKKAQANTVTCPSCKSTNLSKISSAKKAAKVGLFGIFGAGDIGKTYKCNNCGVRF